MPRSTETVLAYVNHCGNNRSEIGIVKAIQELLDRAPTGLRRVVSPPVADRMCRLTCHLRLSIEAVAAFPGFLVIADKQ